MDALHGSKSIKEKEESVIDALCDKKLRILAVFLGIKRNFAAKSQPNDAFWLLDVQMNKKYDIFISYRRTTSFDTANLIAEKLRNAGYRVFFDVDTLNSGKFNVQLLSVIENCKDFILVLPKNALDRCSEPEDWIRQEVIHAMKHDKNIIPVMLAGFTWPQPMPEGMEELSNYQAIASTGHDFFDMAVERLKSYLKSTPSKPIRRWLMKTAMVLAVLVVIFAALVGWGYNMICSIGERVGAQLTSSMAVVDLLASDNHDMEREFHSFVTSLEKAKTDEARTALKSEMHQVLNVFEKGLKSYAETIPERSFDLSTLELYLMRLHGIKAEELEAFILWYDSEFTDLEEQIGLIRAFVDEHSYSKTAQDLIEMNFKGYQNGVNALYYGYLGTLSLLPKSARKTHFDLAKRWTNLPNGTPLDLSQEEYEQFQEAEIARYTSLYKHQSEIVDQQSILLDDLEAEAEND